MKRTCDVAFLECPICGKKPYVDTYYVTVAWAFCKGYGFQTEHGEFGADMQVASVNDGPVTLLFDTDEV